MRANTMTITSSRPSSVRAEPETLTRAVLEDWGRVDPLPPQATQGGAAANRPAADDRASHTTKRSMRSEASRASSMRRHMAIRAQMAGQEQQMQLMMAQMKEVMAAVSATDQHRQRIERNMDHNMNTVADRMFSMQEAIGDGRTAPPPQWGAATRTPGDPRAWR